MATTDIKERFGLVSDGLRVNIDGWMEIEVDGISSRTSVEGQAVRPMFSIHEDYCVDFPDSFSNAAMVASGEALEHLKFNHAGYRGVQWDPEIVF